METRHQSQRIGITWMVKRPLIVREVFRGEEGTWTDKIAVWTPGLPCLPRDCGRLDSRPKSSLFTELFILLCLQRCPSYCKDTLPTPVFEFGFNVKSRLCPQSEEVRDNTMVRSIFLKRSCEFLFVLLTFAICMKRKNFSHKLMPLSPEHKTPKKLDRST